MTTDLKIHVLFHSLCLTFHRIPYARRSLVKNPSEIIDNALKDSLMTHLPEDALFWSTRGMLAPQHNSDTAALHEKAVSSACISSTSQTISKYAASLKTVSKLERSPYWLHSGSSSCKVETSRLTSISSSSYSVQSKSSYISNRVGELESQVLMHGQAIREMTALLHLLIPRQDE